MARYSNALTAVFEAYGDDAEAGLSAYANTDPEGWSAYVDSAATKQFHGDYRNWSRQLTESVVKERLADNAGQPRLFEVDESEARVELRRRLRLGGAEYDLVSLTDTAVVRKVAERDLAPAVTTVARCKNMFRLADHMDAETERLGRPVSAGEVLGWAA